MEQPSPSIQHKTRGKVVLIFGGWTRQQQVRTIALLRHFAFGEVLWYQLKRKEPTEAELKREITRAELVILFAGHVGHTLFTQVRRECSRTRKPLIVLESGFGVTQIEHQLHRQWKGS